MEQLILQVCLMSAMIIKVAPYVIVLGVVAWIFDLW
jgi:hypothetical protein